MAGAQRRKGANGKNKGIHRSLKTRHYGRDHDQIHADMKEEVEKREVDETKPGAGQHYCVSCARHFDSLDSLTTHQTTKKHKRMAKRMLEVPYSHQQAYNAGK